MPLTFGWLLLAVSSIQVDAELILVTISKAPVVPDGHVYCGENGVRTANALHT